MTTEHECKQRFAGLSGRFWYVPDVVLIGYVVAFLTLVHSSYLVWYAGGLHGRAPIAFSPYILCLAVAILPAGVCLLVLINRLLVSWPAHIPDRKRLRRLRLVVGLGLVAYAGLYFLPIPRSCDPFIRGYRQYARTHIDIPAIRTWLGTLDANDWAGARIAPDYLTEEERAGWPGAVISLRPYLIDLFLDAHGHLAVSLMWTSPDDAWGVEIGNADLEISAPKSGKESPGGSTFHEKAQFRLPLASGAYVWHEAH